MKLTIKRVYHAKGTNGDLFADDRFICHTIELPWKENMHQVSCIPEGNYELRKRKTERFGEHFILMYVPGRTGILLHAANDAMKEIKGCIAPVETLTGEGKGNNSRRSLTRLVRLVYPELEKKEKVYLEIRSK